MCVDVGVAMVVLEGPWSATRATRSLMCYFLWVFLQCFCDGSDCCDIFGYLVVNGAVIL